MANVKVFNMSGSEVGSIELNDSIFEKTDKRNCTTILNFL